MVCPAIILLHCHSVPPQQYHSNTEPQMQYGTSILILYLHYTTVHSLLYCTHCNYVPPLQCCTSKAILYMPCNSVPPLQYCISTTILYFHCNTIFQLQYSTSPPILYINCKTILPLQYYTSTVILYLHCNILQ